MAIDKIVAEYRLELDGLKADINQIKGQVKSIDDTVKTSADNSTKKFDEMGNNVSGKLTSAFTKLGGAIAAAFAVERIGAFISSSIELAAKAEGIKTAFDRLNDPTLLSRLREATKGTVSDLQLMQTAVKAANFKLPLEQLATYLKFAQQRAVETGESIDYLVESIVLGISRKSIPILDNLGISAQQVQDEFKKTGDFAAAVGNIINESMTGAAEATLTAAERQAQLRAQLENTKVEIGNGLLPVIAKLADGLNFTIQQINNLLSASYQTPTEELDARIKATEEENRLLQEFTNEIASTSREAVAEYENLLASYGQTAEGITKATGESIKTINEQIKQHQQRNTDYSKALVIGLNIAKDNIADYSRIQLERIESDKKTIEPIEKQTQAVWGLGQALLMLGQTMAENLQSERSIETFAVNVDKAADAMLNARKELDALIDLTPIAGTTTTETTDEMKAGWEDYANSVMGIMDSVSNYFRIQENYKLDLLQRRLDLGMISEMQYADQEKKIRQEQARREKIFSVFNVLANTPPAVMKAAALGGPPLAALAVVQAAVELATALSLPIPAFKDGVIDLKGKGTETSDSNLALLSKGESVITARATRKHKDVLEAIQKDKFEDYIMRVYLKQIQQKQADSAVTWDDYRLLLATQKSIGQSVENTNKIVSAIKENRPHRF